ncbi:hypothetical protein L950_0201200 [Sphingobacterium sp. IITKGP-BTPF85]|nr:hypothetical protein L950_0201200 [Sphingobacterium sp. IITKGP-BTPF85]
MIFKEIIEASDKSMLLADKSIRKRVLIVLTGMTIIKKVSEKTQSRNPKQI